MLRRTLFRVLIAVTVLSAFAASAAGNESEPAPRFHAKTLQGETFTNASVKGKVVLLQFWTTWCGYCRQEQPIIDRIDHDYSGQGLIVLAINVGETKKEVLKYLAGSPRTCRVILTGDTNLAAMFQATSYPIYVLIDRDGNVAYEGRGAMGESRLRRMLRDAGLDPPKE